MYRLRTFGGLFLEQDGVPVDPIGGHRKGLALLAVVAVGGTVGREQLMALLWPESDTERARGSLKQTVHLLRRRLSEPDLLLGTAELRLNPERIDCDAQLFARALQANDLEGAVGWYSGPFLEGVHLDGTPEFERWVDEQRAALARDHMGALEGLAREAGKRGDHPAAVHWWRKLLAVDPLNSRMTLNLMQALESAGDPAGALRQARVHEVLLREELGIVPDAAVAEMVDRLRSAEPGARDLPEPHPGGGASPLPVEPGDREAPAAGDPGGAAADPPGDGVDPSREVSPGPGGSPPRPGAPVLAGPPPGSGNGRPARRLPFRPAAGLGVLLLAGVVGFGVLSMLDLSRAPSAPSPGTLSGSGDGDAQGNSPALAGSSLAVLPFVDMSPGEAHEYFSDGITEEILSVVARIPGLRVPARTSSFHFKGRNLPVGEIARQLGVEHVLEGSVRRTGNRVRVTAQLIDAREDRHIWAESYDRELDDLFEVQEEIARTVAGALQLHLGPGDGVRWGYTASAEAHDLYLRGLFHWNRRSASDLALAVRFFEEATALDPGYARAWAGMALAYAVIPIGFTPAIPPEESWPRAEEAAARALALDPTMAEPHVALAYSYHYRWRREDAEREFLRALALGPRSATVRQWYGEHLAKTGRANEAVEQLRRALDLDPLSLVVHNDLGLVLMLARRPAEAVEQFERTLAMDAGFILPHYFLHRIHLLERRIEESEAAGRRWAELTGVAPAADVVTLTRATLDESLRPDAAATLRRWEAGPAPRWLDISFYWTYLREHEAALDALERGLAQRLPMMAQVGWSPWMDPLMDHPRMDAILREVGFR